MLQSWSVGPCTWDAVDVFWQGHLLLAFIMGEDGDVNQGIGNLSRSTGKDTPALLGGARKLRGASAFAPKRACLSAALALSASAHEWFGVLRMGG